MNYENFKNIKIKEIKKERNKLFKMIIVKKKNIIIVDGKEMFIRKN